MGLCNCVYAGAKSPEALQVNVSPSESVPDLSLVTAAEIQVVKPNGSTETWSATLSNQTTTTLRLTHVFHASGGDVATSGNYRLRVYLTVSGETRRCELRTLPVLPY